MKTSFKASKKGKYFQIDYVTGLDYIPTRYNKYVWCLSKKEASAFIQRVTEIEKEIKEILVKDGLSYDYRLIICLHLNAIENISCGLDIRSNMSSLELAERFVSGYDQRYKDAHKFCQDTIKHVETTGKFDSYMKDWRRHDKHNELVKEFKLPFKQLSLDDFRVDELKNIEFSLDALHKLIDERNNKNE